MLCAAAPSGVPFILPFAKTILRGLSSKLLQLRATGQFGLLVQFIQFGVVGVIGFSADTAVVYALRHRTGLYVAGTASFAVAVSITWWVNRVWTFRGNTQPQAAHRQWARYAIANTPGLVLNRGTYFLLVTISELCAHYPVLAVASGAVAGMFVNFALSRALVFR